VTVEGATVLALKAINTQSGERGWRCVFSRAAGPGTNRTNRAGASGYCEKRKTTPIHAFTWAPEEDCADPAPPYTTYATLPSFCHDGGTPPRLSPQLSTARVMLPREWASAFGQFFRRSQESGRCSRPGECNATIARAKPRRHRRLLRDVVIAADHAAGVPRGVGSRSDLGMQMLGLARLLARRFRRREDPSRVRAWLAGRAQERGRRPSGTSPPRRSMASR
jgi:hypothetical protein